MKTPIFQHREIIGYANNLKHAERVIRKTIDIHPMAKLHVFNRNTDIIDLPAGFVYSVSFGARK